MAPPSIIDSMLDPSDHPVSGPRTRHYYLKHSLSMPLTTATSEANSPSLLELVSREIEELKSLQVQEYQRQKSTITNGRQSPPHSPSCIVDGTTPSIPTTTMTLYHKFPPACLAWLKRLAGNGACLDCGQRCPTWAAVSYGALLCLQCSGHHRSLGVHVSCVRSLEMDEWSLSQIMAMLEGGNAQLRQFFERHFLTVDTTVAVADKNNTPQHTKTITKNNVTRLRYKTKAALFYRQQMALHIAKVLTQPTPYQGRLQQQPQGQAHPRTASSSSSCSRCCRSKHSTME